MTTLLSVWINIETNSQYEIVDDLEENIHELIILHGSGQLPVSVFKNIEAQDSKDDLEKAAKLERAHEASSASIIYQTQTALLLMNEITNNFHDFKKPFEFVKGKDDMRAAFDKSKVDYLQLDYEIDRYLFSEEGNVHSVEYHQGVVEDSLKELLNGFNDYRLSLRSSLMILDYMTTFLTLIVLLILAFFIFRIMYVDIPYIRKSFKLLEDHDYDLKTMALLEPKFKEEKEIHHMITSIFEEQWDSTQFKNQVMDTYLMDEIIDKLYERVNHLFPIERIGIAFVDYSKEKIVAEYGVLKAGQVKLGPGYQVDFAETSLTNFFESKTGLIDNDLLETYKRRNRSGALSHILGEGLKSNMTIPLVSGNTVYGLLFFSSKQKDFFTDDHLRVVNKMAYEISGFLNRAYLTKVILSKITASFAVLVDKKDNETGGHIIRMVSYSVIIAKSLMKMAVEDYAVDKEMILNIERNAAIHDIGKVGIPDAILKKPGKLTPDEWEIMKTHAEIGGDIFKDIRTDMSMFDHDFYAVAEDIARYHHEKFDGSGYPDRLKGKEIPLEARIVALADVFDALTSKRVYKKAFSFEEAIEIIHKDKGTHFDPYVVDAFDFASKEIFKVYDSVD